MTIPHHRVLALAFALAVLAILLAMPVACRKGEPWTTQAAEPAEASRPAR